MKVTPALKEELANWLDTYWNTYLKGDIETWATFIRDDYRNIGGTKEEIWNSKQEIINYTNSILSQMVGTVDIRNREVELIPYGEYMMVHEFTDLYVKVEGEWNFYGPFRMSSLLEKTDTGWIALHQHGSYPDMKAMEGEAFSIDALKAENARLQAAVKSRTIELEIETALEKVRAEAMGIKKPDDILAVCEIMFRELQLLGFPELRNTLINFWDDESSSLIDYDYSDETGGHKAILSYSSHPVFEQFQKKIKHSQDAFAELVVTKDELESWKQRRRDSGEYEDPRLNEIDALYYYFYSIAVGAIGISTFKSITEEQLNILKRFRNVFDFAYRRYADVAQAEAQTREAEIQLALERVRARSMAMHKSEELSVLSLELVKQVQALGVATWFCAFNVNDEDPNSSLEWGSNGQGTFPKYRTPREGVFLRYYQAGQRGETFVINEIGENECPAHYEYLCGLPDVGDQLLQMKAAGIPFPASQIDHIAFFKYGYLLFITYEPVPEAHDIFKRFAKVFEQTYTRFLDLQKAEAQAREAQIEASLERVRSASMAMHSSDELQNVIRVLTDQLAVLEFEFHTANFITNDSMPDWEIWISSPGSNISPKLFVPYFNHRLFNERNDAVTSGKDILTVVLNPEEKRSFLNYFFEHSSAKNTDNERIKWVLDQPGMALTTVVTKSFSLSVINYYGKLYTESENEVIKRLAFVFEQSYTRFLDLQKAEAQAREAQIELALERVRAKAMAMQGPKDFVEVINLMGEQFIHLDFDIEWVNFGANGLDVSKGIDTWNFAVIPGSNPISSRLFIPYFDHPLFLEAVERLDNYHKTGKDLFELSYGKEDKNRWLDHLIANTVFKDLPEEHKAVQYAKPGYTTSNIALKDTWLSIGKFDRRSFTDEQHAILRRFGNAFGQAYTRFLDLQKAEAQAREAKIEAALEKVRSSSMAMHKSNELHEVINVVTEQFQQLGFQFDTANFITNYTKNGADWWVSTPGVTTPEKMYFPSANIRFFHSLDGMMSKEVDFFSESFSFEEKNEFFDFAYENTKLKYLPEERKKYIYTTKGIAFSSVISKNIVLSVANYQLIPYTEEENSIIKRIGKVFEQSYTRFLDLQKAEAQAKEAQVEAALERVRSRTNAMQGSENLFDVIREVNDQLLQLGFRFDSADFMTEYSEKGYKIWLASAQETFSTPMYITSSDTKIPGLLKEVMERGDDFFTFTLNRAEKDRYFEHVFSTPAAKNASEESKQYIFNSEGMAVSCVVVKNIILSIANFACIPYTDSENDIIKRFGFAFEQSYTRFLDLQKAEALAREAQIEAALERVRSRTIGMQKSEELREVIQIVFEQLRYLDFKIDSAHFNLNYKESDDYNLWTAAPGQPYPVKTYIPYFNHPVFITAREAKEKGLDFFTESYTQEEKNEFFEHLFSYAPGIPEERRKYILSGQGVAASTVLLNQISLWIMNYSGVPYSAAENGILKRFGKIFEQSHTRFLDLQKAEAQAREAVKQASLDRIRAEIASMRTTGDLETITPLIWNELTVLGVPFIRCGVFIMNDLERIAHTYLSTPDGKAIAAFDLAYDTPGNISQIVHHWQNKKLYIDYWDEEAYTAFAGDLVQKGIFTSPEQYFSTLPGGGFYLHFAPFLQGMLYVGNTTQLPDEEINLIQSVADAFATAYARYEDFNKLEAAKKQVDNTLNELQLTQKQLIQSEKMASLGELTAGIAHEIQNPLNFVNNFSEVNRELTIELEETIDKGNYIEAKAIAKDIRDNEQKINHHGKRADAIVKGMLQHSRSSTGAKEPTDINVLADEYLRLAYHGLRAKNKSFNATLRTDYDENIGKINIIPQDVGRVILNLITNAFYAVTEKKKEQPTGYEPTVSVTTKKRNGKIEICVADNGNGIPQTVLDKIFQPFFTTKPTGQGTGLGLSLSYDIVKAHGGELTVETGENKGSEFIIQLPI